MRKLVLVAAVAALAGCSKEKAAEANADANVADANVAMAGGNAATPAAFSIDHTSWQYMHPTAKKMVEETVDDSGNYVTWAGSQHVDHGTAVMKDGKACFTSKMNKDGEMCWTDPKLEPGASGVTVSDKGERLPIKRIAYTAVPANVAP
jgi:hypothetical protein